MLTFQQLKYISDCAARSGLDVSSSYIWSVEDSSPSWRKCITLTLRKSEVTRTLPALVSLCPLLLAHHSAGAPPVLTQPQGWGWGRGRDPGFPDPIPLWRVRTVHVSPSPSHISETPSECPHLEQRPWPLAETSPPGEHPAQVLLPEPSAACPHRPAISKSLRAPALTTY